MWISGIDLTQEDKRLKERQVRNALMRCKGVRGFGSVLLRHKLAQGEARGFESALLRCKLTWGGARGFGMGNGCLGMVLKTQE